MAIRIGLVGYGVGGRLFHAPYLQASDQCELVGVVARSSERIAQVHEDLPDVPVFSSLEDLAHAGAEAVVISTPPTTRQALVLEALGLGMHVVADKPFAPSAAAARELADAADAAGLLLNVFHNRRLDADIVTARGVLDSGVLGELRRLDLRCDQDDPSTLEAGEGGGLLRDLGSHVVDQALYLCGPARRVHAILDVVELPAGVTDCGFAVTIEHANGCHSHISSSKLDRLASREIRLHGTEGSYVSDYTDVQVDAVLAGERPAGSRDTWGYESPARWGALRTGAGETRVPSAQGDYTAYYDAFAAAVLAGRHGPVPADEGIAVLAVLDAARESAARGSVVDLL